MIAPVRHVPPESLRARPGAARWLLPAVGLALVGISAPVILRGGLLADDFHNCLEPQRVGLGSFFIDSWARLRLIRLARFGEILLTTGACRGHVPFGAAIAVPLALTLSVAVLLRGVLKDLGIASPWPELGGALWLLQPLGTESALWPAALHVTLGLALALAGLRLLRSKRPAWGCLALAGAILSLEQIILALPLAVWLAVPPPSRRRAMLAAASICVVALLAFVLLPGNDPRLNAGLADRVAVASHGLGFYALFPAVGVGAHSIPLAVLWSFPYGLILLAGGAVLGWVLASPLFGREEDGQPIRAGKVLAGGLALAILLNVPVALSVPRQESPRLFAPTWLAISTMAALLAGRVPRGRRPLVGVGFGLFAAGALLSLALSVWVRVATANFTETSSRLFGAEVPDGGRVAVCGIRRTVVDPAPRGSFAIHELVYPWSAEDAVYYYTGKTIQFVLAGELWNRSCPARSTVSRVFWFPDLVDRARSP